MIIDCGDEENPEPEDDIEYDEDYDDSTPSDPDGPDNPDDPTPEPEPEPEPVEGETLVITNTADDSVIAGSLVNGVMVYNISQSGTYDVAMAQDVTSANNTRIIVSGSDSIRLNLHEITINNTALNDDTPAIIASSSNNINIYLYGDNYIVGNSTYLVSPANGVITSQGTGDLFFYGTGSLTVTDPMDSTADYSEVGLSAAIYANGNIGNYSNLRLVSNGSGIVAHGNISDYQGTYNITSRLKDGIEATGDLSLDASNVTISALNGNAKGINITGDLVAAGFTNINITVSDAANGISANSQNIADSATVNITVPEEIPDDSAEMEP